MFRSNSPLPNSRGMVLSRLFLSSLISEFVYCISPCRAPVIDVVDGIQNHRSVSMDFSVCGNEVAWAYIVRLLMGLMTLRAPVVDWVVVGMIVVMMIEMRIVAPLAAVRVAPLFSLLSRSFWLTLYSVKCVCLLAHLLVLSAVLRCTAILIFGVVIPLFFDNY